ncbi:MAG: hypothetical protein HGA67_04175 [Candidatus Yonathbacteria bacterium]|nr:hypothetical protein [Candidatus Yonathbacteria bacterium]
MEHPEKGTAQERREQGDEFPEKGKDSASKPEEIIDPRWKDAEEKANALGVEGISGLREEQKVRREDVESKREHELEMKKSYECNLERVRGEMEMLRGEMESKKQSILSRIFEWKRIRELKRELTRSAGVAESYGEEIQGREKMLEQFDVLLDLESKYEGYLDTLEREKIQEAREALEEERQRGLDSLIKKHNVYFVHRFVTGEYKPSQNNRSIDTRGLTVEDQLDIALSIKAPLSTSTLHPGTEEGLFSDVLGKGEGFGVLLSGGRAQGGGASDIGSVALNREERLISKETKTLKSVEDGIVKSFFGGDPQYQESTSYNEIVVQQPEIAGVVFNWLEGTGNQGVLQEEGENTLIDGKGTKYGRWWERVANIQKRNTPIFVLDRKDNTVRQVYDINIEKRTFRVTPVWTPDMFVNMPGIYKQHIDPEEKKRAIGRVYDHVSGILTDEEKQTARFGGKEHERVWTYVNPS